MPNMGQAALPLARTPCLRLKFDLSRAPQRHLLRLFHSPTSIRVATKRKVGILDLGFPNALSYIAQRSPGGRNVVHLARNLLPVKTPRRRATRRRHALGRGAENAGGDLEKRVKYLDDNLGAVNVRLTAEDLDEIDAILSAGAASGERYQTQSMQAIDR